MGLISSLLLALKITEKLKLTKGWKKYRVLPKNSILSACANNALYTIAWKLRDDSFGVNPQKV